MDIIEQLKNQVIISVQAAKGEPLYEEAALTAMMKSAVNGGAKGLRLAGARDIRNAKKLFNIPVIGLTKPDKLPENWKSIVYITPSIKDAELIINAGADITACDASLRKHPYESPAEILDFIHQNKRLAMADISNFEEGINAAELGFDIISTTLSGYTQNSGCSQKEPDFELLEKLVKTVKTPVVLEGRIWEPEQVSRAFKLGAHSVVIGSAVTRPQLITKRFIERG